MAEPKTDTRKDDPKTPSPLLTPEVKPKPARDADTATSKTIGKVGLWVSFGLAILVAIALIVVLVRSHSNSTTGVGDTGIATPSVTAAVPRTAQSAIPLASQPKAHWGALVFEKKGEKSKAIPTVGGMSIEWDGRDAKIHCRYSDREVAYGPGEPGCPDGWSDVYVTNLKDGPNTVLYAYRE